MKHDWKTEFGMAVDLLNGTSYALAEIDARRRRVQRVLCDAQTILAHRDIHHPKQVRWAKRIVMKYEQHESIFLHH